MRKTVRILLVLSLALHLSCKNGCDLADLVQSTCKDHEGTTYPTVIFPNGSEWMAENLRVASINTTQDTMDYCTSDSLWELSEQAYFTQYDNYTPNETGYGKLYNYKAATSEGLCPEGFHVPTAEEWDELLDCLGGANDAGAALREANFNYWNPVDNITSTNESLMTIRPGGFRAEDGQFHNQRFFAYFWTSTGEDGQAQMRSLHYASDAVSEFEISTSAGASVRCMR